MFHAQGLGWLLRALPLVGVAAILLWLATARMRLHLQAPARILGLSLAVSLVGLVLRPWVGLAKLGQSAAGGRSKDMFIEVISSGVLPITVGRTDGPAGPRLINGQSTTIRFPGAADNTDYFISTHLALGPWWWLAVIALCLTPLLWCFVVGVPAVSHPTSDSGSLDSTAAAAIA